MAESYSVNVASVSLPKDMASEQRQAEKRFEHHQAANKLRKGGKRMHSRNALGILDKATARCFFVCVFLCVCVCVSVWLFI